MDAFPELPVSELNRLPVCLNFRGLSKANGNPVYFCIQHFIQKSEGSWEGRGVAREGGREEGERGREREEGKERG